MAVNTLTVYYLGTIEQIYKGDVLDIENLAKKLPVFFSG
jgi:hypothetical protein